jgi:eukaryotic-like serine/threonine-protein kinase
MEPHTDSPNPLRSGARLGPYTILGRLGSGGMGEVYRARDPKLERDVAVKVLLPGFATHPERLARFQREARVLASLNHPHIAGIFGLEDSGGTPALIMELVEGPTLADRLVQGPIPIEETLSMARQMADGLEYAHEQGIVHRDLKPANVKVGSDDSLKILDFGLAKALDTDEPSAHKANSSTVTWMATQAGMLLGTAAYMAPEQAKGKPVDRRADVWAFGCVLYEMLTGTVAFCGETVTDTLAAVVREEPDWTRLPAGTPPQLGTLLRRCLQKDPRQRLQAIGDARIALDEILSDPAASASRPERAQRSKSWLAAGLAGGLLGAIGAGLVVWNLKSSQVPPRPVTRFTIALHKDQRLAGLDKTALALSADGNQLAYVATTAAATGTQQIYLRAMDGTQARPLPGTEGSTNPFFSPDGQWLGFFADGKLKKIPVKGGVAETLTEVVNALGASWSTDHTIAFAPYASAVQQVSDNGGTPQPLTRFDSERPSTSGRSGCPAAEPCSSVRLRPARRSSRCSDLARVNTKR